MAQLLNLQTISSEKGSLTVFEKILPEGIKRIFYIYDAKDQIRGGHRHKLAYNALTCVSGKCKVFVDNGEINETYELDTPNACLLLDPIDWHEMYDFSEDAVLLVMSNRFYEAEDYIYEKHEELEKTTVE